MDIWPCPSGIKSFRWVRINTEPLEVLVRGALLCRRVREQVFPPRTVVNRRKPITVRSA